jgi:hypothetical protein
MAHGWAGTAADLVAADPTATLHRLSEQHERLYRDRPGVGQTTAWTAELHWVAAALRSIDRAAEWGVVLEYELPFEGGRRPDVIVLPGSSVLVLEFKDTFEFDRAHIDQVDAYARDLSEYHTACRDLPVIPILVYTNRGGLDDSHEGVRVIGPDVLPRLFRDHEGEEGRVGLAEWSMGRYEPLPSLVTAARRLFNHEPLPAIRRAASIGIPQLLESLHSLVAAAASKGERHLVLITGVPGSGKTLVGLQFVYDVSSGAQPRATFYSGNGPLVDVVQDALKSKVFVSHWRNFDLEVGARGTDPPANALVFDEAQRAWDRTRMKLKHGLTMSEPELAVAVAARIPGWGVIIGLIGEGQEIHVGEEAGLRQWADALREISAPFVAHVPSHLAAVFDGLDVVPDDRLNLTTSLRTHRAHVSHRWVAEFLGGNLEQARLLADQLTAAAFDMYVTSDLHAAKSYLFKRYEAEPEKRFGLVASSKAGNLVELGINNRDRWPRYVPWFNAPRTDPRSSCQLSAPLTEFHCQGLELDMPLLCWGDDLVWKPGWASTRRTRDAADSRQLRINSYRVLLTRGRDGFVVFLPPNLADGQMVAVRGALVAAGVEELTSLSR